MEIDTDRSDDDDESMTEDIDSDENDNDLEEEIKGAPEDTDEEPGDVSFDLEYRQNEVMEKLSTVFRLLNVGPIHVK